MCVSFFSVPSRADAASLSLTPSTGAYTVGNIIKVRVSVASGTQSVNAVSGIVTYPSSIMSLSSVSKENSLITLWAKEPTFSNTTGSVSFEGVILNGYQGSSGTVLTLIFRAKKEGSASIKLSNSSTVLANDGVGTNVLTGVGGAFFTIGPGTEVQETPPPVSDTAGIAIDMISKDDPRDAKTSFSVVINNKKTEQVYDVSIDNNYISVWVDDGSHIYETPALRPGDHTITLKTTDNKGSVLSGAKTFSITAVLKPVIVEYQKEVLNDQYIVVKGKADPLTTVIVYLSKINDTTTVYSADTTEAKTITSYMTTQNDGTFTFVSESKMTPGVYIVTAQAKIDSGSQSELTDPIKILVRGDVEQNDNSWFKTWWGIVLLSLFLLLLLLLLFLFVKKIIFADRKKKSVQEKLMNVQNLISQNLGGIGDDINKEASIVRKLMSHEPLADNEYLFTTKIKSDVDQARDSINQQLKDISKNI